MLRAGSARRRPRGARPRMPGAPPAPPPRPPGAGPGIRWRCAVDCAARLLKRWPFFLRSHTHRVASLSLSLSLSHTRARARADAPGGMCRHTAHSGRHPHLCATADLPDPALFDSLATVYRPNGHRFNRPHTSAAESLVPFRPQPSNSSQKWPSSSVTTYMAPHAQSLPQ